jgi:hypothetical protein
MKLYIYLCPEGAVAHAAGKPLETWHFTVDREPTRVFNGTDYRADHIRIAETPAQFPDPKDLIPQALAHLKAQEDQIKATAFEHLSRIELERSKLLALPSPTFTEELDDVPF